MTRRIAIGLALAAACVIAFLSGPRADLDGSVPHVHLPTEVDEFIAERERRMADLTPGTEAVVWRPDGVRQTPLSVVYLHGFSASRRESEPVSDSVAARLGANLYYARLSGHGLPGEYLGDVSAEDWLRDAVEAFEIGRRIGERVVVIGTSTGATLATWLAAAHPHASDIAALILMSPNFAPADPRADMVLWPWGRQLLRMIQGPIREWEPVNEEQRRYWTTRYPSEVVLEVMALVEHVRTLPLDTIGVPVFLIYSTHDEVVLPDAMIDAVFRMGSGTREVREVGRIGVGSNHVLAGRILAPEATEATVSAIVDFVIRADSGAARIDDSEPGSAPGS